MQCTAYVISNSEPQYILIMTLNITGAKLSPGRLVAFAVIGALSTLIVLIVFVNGGLVRHVPITWQEKIETTIAFRTIAGELKVVGIKGNGAINPTLLMRTRDFAMVLTVLNQDNSPHMLYVDRLNVHTGFLWPGENQTITFYSPTEDTYNYYDRLSGSSKPIGQIKAVKVTAYE